MTDRIVEGLTLFLNNDTVEWKVTENVTVKIERVGYSHRLLQKDMGNRWLVIKRYYNLSVPYAPSTMRTQFYGIVLRAPSTKPVRIKGVDGFSTSTTKNLAKDARKSAIIVKNIKKLIEN